MPEAKTIVIPRDILLVEIDRRCSFADCDKRVFIGLTKNEAEDYSGFECEYCKRWNADTLTEKDVPDWWSEIQSLNHSTH